MTSTLLRPLQISMTVMVGFAAIVLALAEGGPISGVTIPLCLATLYFIDIQKLAAVPVFVANGAGIVSFLVAGTEFFSGGIESRLLAAEHLLVYLTWVFLLQSKREREYWWLVALSTLQVALSSVMTDSLWFGAGLVVYAVLMTWTLAVFLLYRSTQAAMNEAAIERSWRPVKEMRGSAPVFGKSRAGVSSDVDQHLLNGRFVGTSLSLTCLALAMSATIFLLTPRVWIGNFTIFGDAPIGGGRSLTGFTDEVRLGDLGEILESSEPVMEVRLFHPDGRQMSPQEGREYLGEEPLFRGAILEQYQDGRWVRAEWDDGIPVSSRTPPGAIRQDIVLEPIGVRTLFTFGNVATVISNSGGRVRTEAFSGEFLRSRGSSSDRRMQYTVYAFAGPPDAVQAVLRSRWPGPAKRGFVQYLNTMLNVAPRLERLSELARKIADGAESPQSAAERLLSYLRDSPEFSYSTALEVVDPAIDPVEDFLFNRRKGHCEYYASSLALMLRSVGVPARVASGFKGASQNENGNSFQVQQLHAHTWVEAMIGGRWVTLDPTPPARDAAVSQIQGQAGFFTSLKQTMQSLWSTGTRMSESQQRELIYHPLQESAVRSWEFTKGLVEGNDRAVQQAIAFLRDPQRWISWQGGVIAFVLMLALTGAVWTVKKILRRIAGWQRSLGDIRQRGMRVAFYERFRAIVEKQGIRQSPTQTAREFVRDALLKLNGRLPAAGRTEWPDELAERFYDVRFGGRDLHASELGDIDRRLTELERALSSNGRQA